MIVLGIDPGLASLGWGVIDSQKGRHRHVAHGVVKTEPGQPQEQRLLFIFQKIKELIAAYKPVAAGIENLYFVKNISSGLPVAEVRGIVLLALAQEGVVVGQYNPTQIKSALVGVGRAEKSQVQEMVKLLLGLNEIPKPDHAADALAAAVCHVHLSSEPLFKSGGMKG